MDKDWCFGEEFRTLCRGSWEKVYLKFDRPPGATSPNESLISTTKTFPFEEQAPRRTTSPQCTHSDAGSTAFDLDFSIFKGDHFVPMSDPSVNDGRSALCVTVEMGISSNVEALLAAGYDVNTSKDIDGSAPIHLAVSHRLYDIIKVLLRHRCALDVYNGSGYTPLHTAILNRDEHALRLMCSYLRSRLPIREGITGDFRCSDIDLRASFSGETCLHIAVEQNSCEIVKILTDEGASVEMVNYFSQTPLVLACRYNYIAIADVLLGAGANPNTTGSFGNQRNTPLALAAKYNYLQLARLLVQYGADVNLGDDSGPCPLFTSLLCASEDVTTFLLTECLGRGLDVTLSKMNGETLLHALLTYKGEMRIEFAKVLVQNGCSVNQANRAKQFPLHETVARRDYAMTSALLDLGADMGVFDRWGQNALHISVALGLKKITKLLLAAGADINSVTSSGRSVLYIALDQGYLDIARFLVAHGFNLRKELYLIHDSGEDVRRRKLPLMLSSNTELMEYLQQHALSPATLFVISMTTVRRLLLLGNSSLESALQLPIPQFLRHFICYDTLL
ncbi:ankyrin-3-like [Gigantopelta aegis]|uniref:ankyrin-3-like n=1 Tax=Gigantopelta aegis TaxID=1735272 RepID=UPI001B88E590|nr:ankyrin-3-like [Gigantopelta aegis]